MSCDWCNAAMCEAYFKLAQVKVFVQSLGLGCWKYVPVNLLRDALLITHGACIESCYGVVIVQISASDLH